MVIIVRPSRENSLFRRLWAIGRETWRRWSANDGGLLAAATAYYAALSFFPLLLVLISALGFALRFSAAAQDAQNALLRLLSENVSKVLSDEVAAILTEVQARAPVSGPVAIGTLLLGAIGIFTQFQTAFDRMWGQPTSQRRGIPAALRNALWHRLRAFLVLVGLGCLVVVLFFAGFYLRVFKTYANGLPVGDSTWEVVQWAVGIALNAAVFTLLYKNMPRVSVQWRHALAGGLLVAIVWQIGSQVLAAIVVARNYTAYGVVGSFIAVMLWVYCAMTLIYFGGQFVEVLENPTAQPKPS